MRPLAAASAVLGMLAVVCGGLLVQTGMRGLHMWPPDRGALWAQMWSSRLFLPAVISAVVALVFGFQAARDSSATRRMVNTGQLLALAGLLLALWAWVVVPLNFAASWSRGPQCLSNVKNVASALEMYLLDYSRFPGQDRWCDTLDEYVKSQEVFHCPQAQATCGYAFNTTLDGSDAHMVDPARAVAVFDADGGWNAHGGKELLPDFPRHLGGDNYGFPDGHGTWYARKRPRGGVRWDTKWPREPNDASLQWGPEKPRQP